jgi:hypothetical protein
VEVQTTVQSGTVQYCTVCSRGSVDLLPVSDGGRGRVGQNTDSAEDTGIIIMWDWVGVGQLKCSSFLGASLTVHALVAASATSCRSIREAGWHRYQKFKETKPNKTSAKKG